MNHHDVEQLRRKLETQRQETLRSLSRFEGEARSLEIDSPQDAADRCVISMSKESLFERGSELRSLLRLIEAALHRMSDGSFGVCGACGGDIPDRRLQALPWTQFCIPCQEAIEKQMGASLSARAGTVLPRGLRRTG